MSVFKSALAAASVLSVFASSSTAFAEPVRASASFPAAAPVSNAPVKKMQARRTRSPLSRESAAISAPTIPIIAGATFLSISGAFFIFRNNDSGKEFQVPVSS